MSRISIIIPVRNEAAGIQQCLHGLKTLRQHGHEVIVVDGGSKDDTLLLAKPLADQVLSSPAGRAKQMNAGAGIACGDILLFLHADTALPEQAEALVCHALNSTCWGRFDVRLSGQHPCFSIIEAMMNLRSRLTGIATGDQCLFVRREVFEQQGGYAQLALMEDIEMSRRLKKLARPACLSARVETSSRRWEQHGILRTVALMWLLRLGFFLGIPSQRLARVYHG